MFFERDDFMRIKGNILTIRELFSINENESDDSNKFLSINVKKFKVPKYQREIKWSVSDAARLIDDIYKKPIFIGNIILSSSNETYDIIDGQQRITTLLMLIEIANLKHQNNLSNMISTRELIIESFNGYSEALKKSFMRNSLTKDIIKSDKLCQIDNYKLIYDTIFEMPILQIPYQANQLIGNLFKSQVNLVLSEEQSFTENINYFLDVNVKAVTLDREDIFKGTLLRNTIERDGVNLDNWYEIKQTHYKINASLSKDSEMLDLMMFIEQYYYYYFAKNDKFKAISFASNFTINQEFSCDGLTHKIDTHILDILGPKLVKETLGYILQVIKFVKDIILSPNSTIDGFKQIASIHNIDDKETQVMYFFLRSITLNEFSLLKILAIYYYFEVICLKSSTKEDFRKIYAIQYYSITFGLISKKDSNLIYPIVKEDDIVDALLIKSSNLLKDRLQVTRKFMKRGTDNTNEKDYITARILASLYNYFNIITINGKKSLRKPNIELLHDFITNKSKYSAEHLIVNKSFRYASATESGVYPIEYKTYKNSLMNFIFIPSLNNNDLENLPIYEKISYLKGHLDDFNCSYSKTVISKIYELIMQKYSGNTKNSSLFANQDFIIETIKIIQDILSTIL